MTENLKKIIIFIAASVFLLYVITGLIISFVMINFFIKRPAKGWPDPIENIKGSRTPFESIIKESRAWLTAKNPETVTITSFDGIELSADILSVPDQKNSKGTVILMHGYHSRASFEFSGFYQFFYKSGYNIILADQRSHGKSGGEYLSFGLKERYDCRDWVLFANKRFDRSKPVYLCGVSMGSSTVLMALGLELPENVKGVIADCGYTSPAKIVELCLKRDYHLPAPLFMPLINICLKIKFGYSLSEYSTLDAIKANTIPVLFIHGTNDKLVPFSMGKENYDACTAVKQFLRTDAEHAASFLNNTAIYQKALEEFLK